MDTSPSFYHHAHHQQQHHHQFYAMCSPHQLHMYSQDMGTMDFPTLSSLDSVELVQNHFSGMNADWMHFGQHSMGFANAQQNNGTIVPTSQQQQQTSTYHPQQ